MAHLAETETVAAALATAAAGYRRFADRAATAPRGLATRLGGWNVGALIDHVCWGSAMEAAALCAAAGRHAPTDSRSLEDAVAAFTDAARIPIAASSAVTLPTGTVPAAFAAQLFAFEAALHDLDLAEALGATGTALSADELLACQVVLGPMLDLLGGASPHHAPPGEVTIDLIGLGDGLRLAASGGIWHRSVPTGRATTTVTGSPDEIVLFACGRLSADDVEVSGERQHAERFKTYFPGP
ncbi:hypothetical protein ACLM5J_16765 [Nocardioides sp. Bht2]|uniref:hypothetical protein n=1 Tax=Nocardioides sp. Bht2 TaxID=3392297 RepID=UPI0039B4D4B9